MLRQGANVKLSAELQVGAAGKIETESKNKNSLRGGRAKSPGRGCRPAPVTLASPSGPSSQGALSACRSASPGRPTSAQPTSAVNRVVAARREFAERQRAKRPASAAPAASERPNPRTSALPDMFDLGWPAEGASPGRVGPPADSATGGGGRAAALTPRATSVTFAASEHGGEELHPEQRR